MAVVYSNNLGLKKLFGEETEEEKKAAEECAAAAKAKESATSKVLCEDSPCLYTCFCYPKEELKKEELKKDEELYRSLFKVVLPRIFKFLAAQSRYNNEELPKMFNEWATMRRKRYYSLYEWRLRFKIWCSTKKMIEHRCLISGETFSINKMNSSADMTVMEHELLHVFKPDRVPLVEVDRKILICMGKSWMLETAKEFEKWAERHERVYSSIEEKVERTFAYLENMRRIDMQEERYPGEWTHGKDLENMDKFDWECDLIPPVKCSRCKPYRGTVKPWDLATPKAKGG